MLGTNFDSAIIRHMDETSDDMYMPAWHRGHGAKNMAKNDKDSMHHTALIQRDVCYTAIGGGAKPSCEFASFPTWDSFKAYMSNVSTAMRSFYELIPPEASRLYTDVELDRYKNGDVLLASGHPRKSSYMTFYLILQSFLKSALILS